MKLGVCCALFLLFAGCAELPDIESDTCGNAVREPDNDEDCDGYVDQARLPGGSCRPKGETGACHFDCTLVDGRRPPCPPEMACATDGICRRLTGELAPPVNLSSDVASWFSALDFDGDGQMELVSTEPVDQLQQARFRLHYFDHDGDIQDTRTFPRITSRPLGRELDGVQGTDLVFSNLRIGMMFGRSDREWVPEALSSYIVSNEGLRTVSVRNDEVSAVPPLVAFTTLDGKSGAFVPLVDLVQGGSRLVPRAPLRRPLTDLLGEPIAANLFSGSDSPCDEVVFGFRGDNSVQVLDMCEPGASGTASEQAVWREAAVESTVRLPDGATLDVGPLVADVNGDGHLDLLLGNGTSSYVAYGDGAMLSEVAEPLLLRVYSSGRPDAVAVPKALPMPLAAGELTADGVADFVFPSGVLSSRVTADGSSAYFPSFGNNSEPWTMAKVADLNGNGLPDVVAASRGGVGFTFLNGTGGPYQVGARLGAHAGLRLLTTGDFDGDLVGDTAFIEDDPMSPGYGVLAVAFGRRDGTPLPATRIAKMRGVEQLGSYRARGLDAIMAASLVMDQGRPRGTLTLFDGNSDRLPFAPYSLVPFSATRELEDQAAYGLAIGSFTGRGASDVIALGAFSTAQAWDLWLLPKIASEQQPPERLTTPAAEGALPFTVSESEAAHLSLAATAADLDGDGLDESLWLMPVHAPSVDDRPGETIGCALLAYTIDEKALMARQRLRLDWGEKCTKPELVAKDLDDDGALDLLLLIGEPASGRRLKVLWNDGRGAFSSEQSTEIGGTPSGDDAEPLDIRAVTVLPGAPSDIAFVSSGSFYLARGTNARRYTQIREVPGFTEAQAVTSLDVNADGTHELLVGDAQGIWLLARELQ